MVYRSHVLPHVASRPAERRKREADAETLSVPKDPLPKRPCFREWAGARAEKARALPPPR